MTDPLKAFLQTTALVAPAFSPDSRYHGLETAQWTRPDGAPVTYVRRRFAPQPETLTTVSEHSVEVGDRLDTLAAKYLGDPKQYWRLCDGNGAIRPNDMTETPGKRLRITLPEGVSGGGSV